MAEQLKCQVADSPQQTHDTKNRKKGVRPLYAHDFIQTRGQRDAAAIRMRPMQLQRTFPNMVILHPPEPSIACRYSPAIQRLLPVKAPKRQQIKIPSDRIQLAVRLQNPTGTSGTRNSHASAYRR